MANAKKCDRCNKLYEEYNTSCNRKNLNGIQLISSDIHHRYYGYTCLDLCPGCMAEFQKWFEQFGSKKFEEE